MSAQTPVFDIPLFRTSFPEFENDVKYPTSMIQLWAGLASSLVRPCAWKSQWQMGVSLYVAHEITLSAQNVASARVGGAPGQQGGIANSKTVGNASIGYDTASTAEKDAGYFNLTNYGKQFYRLCRIFGAGAIQL